MKICVVGCGLSGMAFAYEIQKYGIVPDILEMKYSVGDPFIHMANLLHLFRRPIKDVFEHLKDNYGLELKPYCPLKRVVMISEKATSQVTGDLGWNVLRGKSLKSLDMQLFTKIQAPVTVNKSVTIDELLKKYDRVVIASGNKVFAERLGVWQKINDFLVRACRVEGRFDPHSIISWFNTTYAKTGYVYLTAINEKHAVINMVVPETTREETEMLFEKFVYGEKFSFRTYERYYYEHNSGIIKPGYPKNVYFIGNAGGFLDPFLGFGVFSAVLSGILCARAIASGTDFDPSPLTGFVRQMLFYRKMLDKFDNNMLSALVAFLGLPGVRNLVYTSNVNMPKIFYELVGKNK